ncbi:MAG: hypothetical protein WCL30_01085 [Pseudomonadota bacterium]
MITKIYAIFGGVILSTFLFASAQGYAFSSMFENHRHGANASHGGYVGSHSYYHK